MGHGVQWGTRRRALILSPGFSSTPNKQESRMFILRQKVGTRGNPSAFFVFTITSMSSVVLCLCVHRMQERESVKMEFF